MLYKKYILAHPVYPKSVAVSSDHYKTSLTRHLTFSFLYKPFEICGVSYAWGPAISQGLPAPALLPRGPFLRTDGIAHQPAEVLRFGYILHFHCIAGGSGGLGQLPRCTCQQCQLVKGTDRLWTFFWGTGLPWGPGPHAVQCPGLRLWQLLLRGRECSGRGPPGRHPACPQ